MVREFAESATCCGARVRLRVHVGPGDRKTRWERYVQSSQYRWYSHTAGRDPFLWGGRNAVQLFYIISGFLISYVLVERRSYRTLRGFYINRYLRLYPVYGVVAVATLAFFAAEALRYHGPPVEFFAIYRAAPPAADALLLVSNLFLLGQDWVMFSAVEHHSFVLGTDFTQSEIPLWQGLIAPQAWTLGSNLPSISWHRSFLPEGRQSTPYSYCPSRCARIS